MAEIIIETYPNSPPLYRLTMFPSMLSIDLREATVTVDKERRRPFRVVRMKLPDCYKGNMIVTSIRLQEGERVIRLDEDDGDPEDVCLWQHRLARRYLGYFPRWYYYYNDMYIRYRSFIVPLRGE